MMGEQFFVGIGKRQTNFLSREFSVAGVTTIGPVSRMFLL